MLTVEEQRIPWELYAGIAAIVVTSIGVANRFYKRKHRASKPNSSVYNSI